MSDRKGAYGTSSTDANFRRKWDTQAYEKLSKEKDLEEKQRMQANEKLMRQGKRPRLRAKEDLPKPTGLLQQRDKLELDKNLNQTIVVANTGHRGPGQPGFYCEICKRNYRDTTGYLDHINSRAHLRRLGQTTTVERSTLEQVRQRIAELRAQTFDQSSAKEFDFEKRLADIRLQEEERRRRKNAEKKAARHRVREITPPGDTNDIAMAMGFSGFATTKQK